MIDQAKDLLFADFEKVLRYWEDLVDPDGSETAAEDDYDARHLHASELLRGVVRIDGTLDPIGGAIFLTELTRIEGDLFETDWAQAKAEHGEDTTPEHLARTPTQRRADALTEMARRSAAHDPHKDTDGEVRPLLSVHIGPDVVSRMRELASGTVIAPNLLVPHLGQADIERIIYGPNKRVIELSKRDRLFRGGLRRAMQLRDRWCSTPGCTELAQDCDIDHTHPRSQGGETTQEESWPRELYSFVWNHHQVWRWPGSTCGVSKDRSGRERSNTEQQDDNRTAWPQLDFGAHYQRHHQRLEVRHQGPRRLRGTDQGSPRGPIPG